MKWPVDICVTHHFQLSFFSRHTVGLCSIRIIGNQMPSTYLPAEQGTLTLWVNTLKPAEGVPNGASNFQFPSSE